MASKASNVPGNKLKEIDGQKSSNVLLHEAHSLEEFPEWASPDRFAEFMYEALKPYEDPLDDVKQGIRDAFEIRDGERGFVLIASADRRLVGGLIMLRTGMKGYVPENLLLMVAVDPSVRGQGVGSRIIKHAFKAAQGDIKLHVEYDNPAKRLYERLGMVSKYAEMRYQK